MAITELSPQQAPSSARLIGVIALTLALGYLVILAGSLVDGHWLFNSDGQPIANDFVNVWAAGRLALDGHAASAYDLTLHQAAEVQAVGHAFKDYYGWHYPPAFLFVAMLLATLPYTAAAATWLMATLPLYVAAVRVIIGERAGIFVALGWPAALWNVTAGQNGFLTAALSAAHCHRWSATQPSQVFVLVCSATSRISVCCFHLRCWPASAGA